MNSIDILEKTTENLKKYISFSEKECNFPSIFDWNWHMELANDIETLLTAYEKEKRLAETNLKDSKEFQDNMCNHRCILNSKVEELEEELEKEKEKNKSLEQENSFLKMMYRGTDEFKAIENLTKEE